MVWDNIQDFRKWMDIKRYADSTKDQYISHLLQMFHHFGDTTHLTKKDIFHYIAHQVDRWVSLSTQKQLIGAARLYFNEYTWHKIDFQYAYPARTESKLPKVISQKEVQKILHNTSNLKHKSILSILYSGGLRISECLDLQVSNIDSQRMVIHIQQSKWAKDRIIPLSRRLLDLLRSYYKEYKPNTYLFSGQWGGRYSPKSIQNILKISTKKAGIQKNVTPHMLRHSYATHLMENGTDTRYIQALLWHNNIQTTQIYTHVAKNALANITNPFDQLKL